MRKRFEQAVAIAAPLAAVQDRIAELRHDIGAHDRFAVTAVLLDTHTDHGAIVEEYTVRDRFGRRPFALSFDYRTRITLSAAGTVTYDTWLPLGIHLLTRQWCEPHTDDRIWLHESVEITAPRPLLRTVYTAISTAQIALFDTVKADAEQQSIQSR